MLSVISMIWNINCHRVRRLLALWAGSDLEQRESQVAERHLAVCPRCREVWERLQQSQQVLERVRAAPFEERDRAASVWPPVSVWPVSVWPVSIWPAVARHIRSIDDQVVRSNWRDWLPAGAVAAACLGIIAVTLPGMPMAESVSPSVIRSYPATFGPNRQDRNERLANPDNADDQPSF